MKSATETELENIRAIAEHATKRLAELEAKLKEEREAKTRYVPSHGVWMIPVRFDQRAYSRESYSLREPLPVVGRWRSFRSRAAAEAALSHQRHFARLMKLASDLNPSGVPGGRCGVCYAVNGKSQWVVCESPLSRSCDDLFESFETAKAACEIMNREGWLPPSLESAQGFGPLSAE